MSLEKLKDWIGRTQSMEDLAAPFPVRALSATFDEKDDYPPIIVAAAQKLSEDALAGKDSRAIVAGASGQGEAMVANRFKGVRCALYYGNPGVEQVDAAGKKLDILSSTREHNDANALSLGLRFLTLEQAKDAVKAWLAAPFPGEERHLRRIRAIDAGR